MILFCLDEFASFGKLQITESLRKLRKRHIRIMVLTQSLADLDMIYGKDERKAMLGNFKFTILLGCKDTETQEYFSKMIGDKPHLGMTKTKITAQSSNPQSLRTWSKTCTLSVMMERLDCEKTFILNRDF